MAHPAFTSSRQTRLLNLEPGSSSEDLFGDVVVQTLDELPSYDALSYAWDGEAISQSNGIPEKTEILCNGQRIEVSVNLGRALQYLRSENSSRRLWIDKICINQSDHGEREQQIQFMGEIFSHADNVIAWLGDSDENTRTVLDLVRDLRLFMGFEHSQTWHMASGWKSERRESVIDKSLKDLRTPSPIPPELARLPPANDDSWVCLDAFLSRSWFSRVWTVQEVVVSRRCHVVVGKYAITWDDLFQAATALQFGGYTQFLGSGNASVIMCESERQRWQSQRRSSLRSLLAFTRTFKAKETHDKVFGLLPLVNDVCASKLQVQYKRDLTDLFSDVVRACIAEEKSLAILGEVDLRQRGQSEMASWVPDWRQPSPTPIVFNTWSADHRLYQSSGDTEPMTVSSPSPNVLIVRGFLIAPITKVLRMQSLLRLSAATVGQRPRPSAMRWKYTAWQKLYRRAALDSNIPLSVVKSAEIRDRLTLSPTSSAADTGLTPIEMLQITLRRTLTGDLYPRPNGRLSELAIHHHFPAFSEWQQGRNPELPTQVLWEHDRFLKSTMMGRRAFIAGGEENAYLGVGSKTVQEGDWICILLGGDTPFILRHTHNANSDLSNGSEWSLISECYVHGLMDGEAMERTEDQNFQYMDFVLSSPRPSSGYSSKL